MAESKKKPTPEESRPMPPEMANALRNAGRDPDLPPPPKPPLSYDTSAWDGPVWTPHPAAQPAEADWPEPSAAPTDPEEAADFRGDPVADRHLRERPPGDTEAIRQGATLQQLRQLRRQ